MTFKLQVSNNFVITLFYKILNTDFLLI